MSHPVAHTVCPEGPLINTGGEVRAHQPALAQGILTPDLSLYLSVTALLTAATTRPKEGQDQVALVRCLLPATPPPNISSTSGTICSTCEEPSPPADGRPSPPHL